jgi:hypothetical protein
MAANRPARLVFRPEHDEWGLIEEHPALFDAVLVPESYVAPYPPSHHFAANEPTRLTDTAREKGLPHWRDPETPCLCSRTVLRLPATKRLLLTPLAGAFDLPLDPAVLEQPDARWHAVELTLGTQTTCETATGPYVGFDRRDSRGHRLNLQFASDVVRSVDEQIPSAIIQVTHHRLLTGLPAAVAEDYATVGIERVVLRTRGLKSEHVTAEELSALLDVVGAFARLGVGTVVDCAGDLGPVLIAGGADGFSTGTRFFRSVAAAVLSAGGGGGGAPIEAQVAGSWERTERPAEQSVHDTRVENMKTLRELTDLAAADPDALVARLLADSAPQAAVWGAVLRERKRRAA